MVQNVNSKPVLSVGCSLRSPFGFGIKGKSSDLSQVAFRVVLSPLRLSGGSATQNAARLVIGRFCYAPNTPKGTEACAPIPFSEPPANAKGGYRWLT